MKKIKPILLLFFWLLATSTLSAAGRVSGLKNATDTLLKEIIIVSPNSKSVWLGGRVQTIQWKANFTDSVKIELFQNENFLGVIDNKVANFNERQGTEVLWRMPENIPLGDTYKVRISSIKTPEIFAFSEIFVVKKQRINKMVALGLGALALVGVLVTVLFISKRSDSSLPEPPPDPDGGK